MSDEIMLQAAQAMSGGDLLGAMGVFETLIDSEPENSELCHLEPEHQTQAHQIRLDKKKPLFIPISLQSFPLVFCSVLRLVYCH